MNTLPRGRLEPDVRDRVLALAADAERADGVAALSEQAVLRARSERTGPWEHLVVSDRGEVLAYAQVETPPAGPAAAELVVAPAHRRRGLGARLLATVLARHPHVRVWAHGDLPAARALAAARGLRVVRDLWLMGREVIGPGPELPAAPADVRMPDGFSWRTYTPDDAPAWLEVNARAFADHGEQGRLTRADLAAREAEPWFDPAGFFLVEERPADPDTGGPRLAAFHWTKVDDGVGEVYVVGVDPDYQGRGLGRAATELGLAHLRARGVPRIVLYVDGDNAAAVATYVRQGFTRESVDVQFASPPGQVRPAAGMTR